MKLEVVDFCVVILGAAFSFHLAEVDSDPDL
jgi:hypothetical protein